MVYYRAIDSKLSIQTVVHPILKTIGSRKGHPQIWEGPIAYRGVLLISINFHKPMSVQYIFSIAGVFAVAHIISPTGLHQRSINNVFQVT